MTDAESMAFRENVAQALGWVYHPPPPLEPEDDPLFALEGYWTLPDGGMKDVPPFGEPRDGKHYGDIYALPDFAQERMAFGYMLAAVEGEYVDLFNTTYDRHWCAVLGPKSEFEGNGETVGEALGNALILRAKARIDAATCA